jgi:ABC-2 type transport system permease protein
VSIVLLYSAGILLGVRLDVAAWLEMTGLILVGLIPFAVFGILLGHLVTVETMGPAMGGTISLFALLGGSWGPIGNGTWIEPILKCIPSYWITQASQVGISGGGWPPEAWIVIGVWTLVLIRITMRVYARDTKRV